MAFCLRSTQGSAAGAVNLETTAVQSPQPFCSSVCNQLTTSACALAADAGKVSLTLLATLVLGNALAVWAKLLVLCTRDKMARCWQVVL